MQWSVGPYAQQTQQHMGSIHTSTKASAVPELIGVGGGAGGGGAVIGKKPPPVREWNPMVDTEWQLGVRFLMNSSILFVVSVQFILIHVIVF